MTFKNKPILLIDLDDTLAKFCKEIVAKLDQVDKNMIPHVTNEENLLSTIWNLNPSAAKDDGEMAHAALKRIYQSTPSFFRHLEPMDGTLSENCADNILDFLQQNGFEVFICSSPDIVNQTCASDKIAWVYQHFGRFYANRVILTKDKTLVQGDILIDDNHNIRGKIDNPSWKHVRFIGHAPNACFLHHQTLQSDLNGTTAHSLLVDWKDRDNLLDVLNKTLIRID